MSDAWTQYEELKRRMLEISQLETIRMLLDWDEQTELKPPAAEWRGEQAALIEGLAHDRATNPHIGELISELEGKLDEFDPEGVERVNVREWRRDYDRKVKLPRKLVEEMTTTAVQARTAWVEARRVDDFSLFQEWLGKNFKLAREAADCFGHDGNPYDALLDTYEPGMTSEMAGKILSDLRSSLVPLIEAVAGAEHQPDEKVLTGDFDLETQRTFTQEAVAWIGFNLERGGSADTAHPFCTTLGPADIRYGNRFKVNQFSDALMSALHEGGHGIYEQNLPTEHFGTPAGQPVSLGIHESQSRMWENRIGRGHAFWERWLPRAAEFFPELEGRDLDAVHFAINQMKPSLIRVEADELTYNLHILIRFELESAMLNGELNVADLPEAWNGKVHEYLGLEVPSDSQGCMQDIHWSVGLIGYFPTYALGNLYAAQMVNAAEKEIGDFDSLVRKGEILAVREWFTEHVHRHGRRYMPAELVERVSGRKPEAIPLIGGLTKKIRDLYRVSA